MLGDGRPKAVGVWDFFSNAIEEGAILRAGQIEVNVFQWIKAPRRGNRPGQPCFFLSARCSNDVDGSELMKDAQTVVANLSKLVPAPTLLDVYDAYRFRVTLSEVVNSKIYAQAPGVISMAALLNYWPETIRRVSKGSELTVTSHGIHVFRLMPCSKEGGGQQVPLTYARRHSGELSGLGKVTLTFRGRPIIQLEAIS